MVSRLTKYASTVIVAIILTLTCFNVVRAQDSPVLCAPERPQDFGICQASEWATSLSKGLYKVIAHSHNTGPDGDEGGIVYLDGDKQATLGTIDGTQHSVNVTVENSSSELKIVHTPDDPEIHGYGSVTFEVRNITPGQCDSFQVNLDYDTGRIKGSGWGVGTNWQVKNLTTGKIEQSGNSNIAAQIDFPGKVNVDYQLQFKGYDGNWSDQGCIKSFAPAQAELETTISCEQASFVLNTETAGKLYYKFTATSVDGTQTEFEDTIQVSAGQKTQTFPWSLEELGEYQLKRYAEFNGEYEAYALSDEPDITVTCNQPEESRVEATMSCFNTPTLTVYAGEPGSVEFKFQVIQDGNVLQEMSGKEPIDSIGEYPVKGLHWEPVSQYGELLFIKDVTFTGLYGGSAQDYAEYLQICNIPGQTTVDVSASCTVDPQITISSPDESGTVEYEFWVTHQDAPDNPVVKITDSQGYTVGQSVIQDAWNTKFLKFGEYTFWHKVTVDGDFSEPFIVEGNTTDICQQPQQASIALEKSTNGQDADTPQLAPQVTVGDEVTWVYVATNNGQVPLTNIIIIDDKEGQVCNLGSYVLIPGTNVQCQLIGIAEIEGTYANIGTVTGTPAVTNPDGSIIPDVIATDPSHYVAEKVIVKGPTCLGLGLLPQAPQEGDSVTFTAIGDDPTATATISIDGGSPAQMIAHPVNPGWFIYTWQAHGAGNHAARALITGAFGTIIDSSDCTVQFLVTEKPCENCPIDVIVHPDGGRDSGASKEEVNASFGLGPNEESPTPIMGKKGACKDGVMLFQSLTFNKHDDNKGVSLDGSQRVVSIPYTCNQDGSVDAIHYTARCGDTLMMQAGTSDGDHFDASIVTPAPYLTDQGTHATVEVWRDAGGVWYYRWMGDIDHSKSKEFKHNATVWSQVLSYFGFINPHNHVKDDLWKAGSFGHYQLRDRQTGAMLLTGGAQMDQFLKATCGLTFYWRQPGQDVPPWISQNGADLRTNEQYWMLQTSLPKPQTAITGGKYQRWTCQEVIEANEREGDYFGNKYFLNAWMSQGWEIPYTSPQSQGYLARIAQ